MRRRRASESARRPRPSSSSCPGHHHNSDSDEPTKRESDQLVTCPKPGIYQPPVTAGHAARTVDRPARWARFGLRIETTVTSLHLVTSVHTWFGVLGFSTFTRCFSPKLLMGTILVLSLLTGIINILAKRMRVCSCQFKQQG
jgi:hypothetical protein